MSKFDTHRELTELVQVSESQAFKQFLDKRKEYLQNQVNKHIKQKDLTEAYGALARLDDINCMMDRLKQEIFNLRKEQ